MNQARYIMIGGFLGAGKSTAVGELARRLSARGLRVGLITNDQGVDLVDTANLRSQGFAVEEITGGCFCCRFDSLKTAADRLSSDAVPDVFIAEPVGSCTDLVATVSYPLRRLWGEAFKIAPLSVLIDPLRAQRVLGLRQGKRFSERVLYVYRKQIEEADVIVINKIDALPAAEVDELRDALEARHPRKRVVAVSARRGDGLDAWFDLLESEAVEAPTLDIDYDIYADGEALLGWLNATARFAAATPRDAGELLTGLALELQGRLECRGGEVAHLKMTLTPTDGLAGLALVSLVRQDFVPELGHDLEEPASGGRIILNLRAEAAPEVLEDVVREGLAAFAAREGVTLEVEHLERFRPGRPQPTHRIAVNE